MDINFTAHNIRLDDGRTTIPGAPFTMEQDRIFIATRKILNLVFPLNKESFSIVDLGCLEGGYAVEFARMGFNSTGIELRDLNIECCKYVKSNLNLPNLSFEQNDVMNIDQYDAFDAAFCCGLFYHLEKPKYFLEKLAKKTKKLLILDTHFSLESETIQPKFMLSKIEEHEGLKGRWYKEFDDEESHEKRQLMRWSSFENSKSFWIQREEIIDLMYKLGFNTVFEQFDSFSPNISTSLQKKYPVELRGTFIGIKNM